MQKNLSARTIGIAACIIAVLGVIPEIINPLSHRTFREITYLLSTLNLFFINSSITYAHFANVINLAGYLLLFIGGILCLTSKGEKIKLVRFGFTLIFLSAAFSILYLIISAILFRTSWANMLLYILDFGMHIFWVWLSW